MIHKLAFISERCNTREVVVMTESDFIGFIAGKAPHFKTGKAFKDADNT